MIHQSPYQVSFERDSNGKVLWHDITPLDEARELTVDLQHLGGAAMFSEAQAGKVVGAQPVMAVPNPAQDLLDRYKPPEGVIKGTRRYHNALVEVGTDSSAIRSLEFRLGHYTKYGDIDRTLKDVTFDSQGTEILRDLEPDTNREYILDNAGMAPFIKISKDITAEAQGTDPADYTWQAWFRAASDGQLLNFAQWYTERLKDLTNPESRARFIGAMKQDFRRRVTGAIDEGWISEKHSEALETSVNRADVRFFSPFGRVPEAVGGLFQANKGQEHSLVLLPTLSSRHVARHEFGHAFADFDRDSTIEYFNRSLAEKDGADFLIRPRLESMDHLLSIVNEGMVEHLTVSLQDGQPTIVKPSEREVAGVPQTDVASNTYKSYREVLGVLMGGKDKTVSVADLSEVIDGAVDNDFARFAGYLDRKWEGRDVLGEVERVIYWHDLQAKLHDGDEQYTERKLSESIVRQLTY